MYARDSINLLIFNLSDFVCMCCFFGGRALKIKKKKFFAKYFYYIFPKYFDQFQLFRFTFFVNQYREQEWKLLKIPFSAAYSSNQTDCTCCVWFPIHSIFRIQYFQSIYTEHSLTMIFFLLYTHVFFFIFHFPFFIFGCFHSLFAMYLNN